MFVRLLTFAGFVAVAALTLPGLATTYLDRPAKSNTETAARVAPVSTAKYASGKGVRLPADPKGHFFGTFSINGRRETGLVDTGASMIAINMSAARRLGIAVNSLKYNAAVSTANGVVKGAFVALDRVEIGTIGVRNVDALVLPDAALSGTLIGMSFMNKLSSYRVEGGALHLFR
ncbi:TIGR02281 family clan AA aspartic protease [Pararhizobium antarcticum]|uniref:Aspartyl protease n=1 Tax=Pararhizobium antarcticum TaxID=1798805 RepID=A0A657LTX6_9HYPH|nr:TIGR02281 family clan AA aspartic protease [Pararhizobium antarcticum]OJF92112.1 hypothetical protein AX761_21555 [Rhizobium sp. 58]OJF94222.1 hypothetical protein AX760_20550 [Pararhizobium antarcticum]